MNQVVLIMGPTGSGKSTVGAALASRLQIPFLDADDYCPPEARRKMTASVGLTDADRFPWLDRLNRELLSQTEAQVVLSCSAQKETYRERLFKGLPDKRIIYLHGSADLLRRRMEARSDHFMPVALLEGQIAIMEKPALCLSIDVGLPLESVIGKAIAYCR